MKSPTVFFVPHQDDELITMGVAIARCADNGQPVCVLFTDGRNCDTRSILSDGGCCPDLNDSHQYKFDAIEYGKLRDVEFVECCKALGVDDDDIIIDPSRIEDGTATVEAVKTMMVEVLRKYPGARLATHLPIDEILKVDPSLEVFLDDEEMAAFNDESSMPLSAIGAKSGPSFCLEHVWPDGDRMKWATQHGDHFAAGKAALELLEEGAVRDVLFLIEPYHLAQFMAKRNQNLKSAYDVQTLLANEKEFVALNDAIDEYSKWHPEENRFALGLHSARKELEALRLRPFSYCVAVQA